MTVWEGSCEVDPPHSAIRHYGGLLEGVELKRQRRTIECTATQQEVGTSFKPQMVSAPSSKPPTNPSVRRTQSATLHTYYPAEF